MGRWSQNRRAGGGGPQGAASQPSVVVVTATGLFEAIWTFSADVTGSPGDGSGLQINGQDGAVTAIDPGGLVMVTYGDVVNGGDTWAVTGQPPALSTPIEIGQDGLVVI